MKSFWEKPWIGCVADDYTGATDLASMLVRGGARVIQLFEVPTQELVHDPRVARSFREATAVVVALKSRSIAAGDAVKQSLDALRFLQSMGIEQFFFKYCSTFDSTPQGNIGPVADALAEALGVTGVVFCPAFPENGRTVYRGHLFVGDQLLSDSSMRDHPLNPMTDSNLVRVLQAQSGRFVGRWAHAHSQKTGHWIADAVNDDDLKAIARECCDDRLLTGGSAIARYWMEEVLRTRGSNVTSPAPSASGARVLDATKERPCSPPGRSVVLAGSCSVATRGQVDAFRKRHAALDLKLHGDRVEVDAKAAIDWCDREWRDNQDEPLLIASGADVDQVEQLRSRWGEGAAANYVEQTMGRIAAGLVERGVRNLVVAGGETSGAVIQSLNIRAIRIGREVSPGVPVVYPLDRPGLALVLKSGNFGGTNFFTDALAITELASNELASMEDASMEGEPTS